MLALAACLLLSPLSLWPLLLLLAAYLSCDLFFSARGALAQERGRLLAFAALPLLFPAVHIVYGAGTLAGLLGKEKPQA